MTNTVGRTAQDRETYNNYADTVAVQPNSQTSLIKIIPRKLKI